MKNDIDKTWSDFWQPIVAPTGHIDLEQLKKELSDYFVFMDSCSEVYCHVTGGRISKVNTDPKTVCAEADEYYNEIALEYAADETERLSAEVDTLRKALVEIGAKCRDTETTLSDVCRMVGKALS